MERACEGDFDCPVAQARHDRRVEVLAVTTTRLELHADAALVTPLGHLPPEICELIASKLHPKDVTRLRRVCLNWRAVFWNRRVVCAALRGLGPLVSEKLLTSMMRHSDKAFHAISRSSTAQPCGTSKRQRVATHRTVAWEHIVEAMWDECAANTMRASVIEACFTAVPFVEGMSRKEQIMERRALNACAS